MVCKHWLRGLCKMGEACTYHHEYNLRRMPECSHWARHQTCPNGPECLYAHIDPDFKRPACPWYERGFCPLGPYCANRHVKKDAICKFYLAGFCPDGRECKEGAHPRYQAELKKPEVRVFKSPEQLEQERIEREMEAEREAEREREREERGFSMGGGQQRFGGKGRWNKKRRSGRRGQY
ncbi:hypothetical protein W97_03565 [Coniosporium apollinis CBS 100218]|uniref:mRNA 3'-end-processing protein n=1 Tax=Coniosporium apollinis (strain CBS 100218) TaxID=1168221 RepID=R7YRA3_CONA1|nr:uncharacterized protein W97_03565 [Coniosporium apollinis CBS 100218]EON64334.1 hypothetical protein W97_03565 [Coniosporium apollinis CBS 100218]